MTLPIRRPRTVKIADLKNRLSYYLRRVRRGESILVCDRDQVIARIERVAPPVALVVGGEGRGLHRLARERCDRVVRIPLRGRVASLNVSVAAALLLFEVARHLPAAAAGTAAPAGAVPARPAREP